ncbi:MAG: dTMP kinase [Candidatus Paceibacterota bacterium]
MKLIVITGIDGCGKSTQIDMLSGWLTRNKHLVKITKAYDHEAKIILRGYMNNWTNDMAIMFLFQALHAQQHSDTIHALKNGKIVLADRWDESYLAYHSNFGELSNDENLRIKLNQLAFNQLIPDLGFVLKLSPGIARERRRLRGHFERFENRSDDYFELIQSTYLQIANDRGWHILDATCSVDEIHDLIKKEVEAIIQAPCY